MNTDQFLLDLKYKFKEYFPHGYFSYSMSQLGGETYFIHIGLIGDSNDCSNGIRQNDPALTMFSLDGFTIECPYGAGLYCNPEPNTHYAMSRRKIGFRKATKKSYEELLVYMDKYFQKMRQVVNENKQDIYEVEKYDSKYLNAPTKLDKALQ